MMKIVLAGIVLLHALVTGSLLVRCMAADGHVLTELLGHDPCHVQSGTPQTGVGSGTAVDPCADLLMSNPAEIQAATQSPAPEPVGLVCRAQCTLPEDAFDFVSAVWKPPCGVKAGPSVSQSLRI